MEIEVDTSDLEKILDTLHANAAFHKHRDLMNSALHLAQECRYSPLTSETFAAEERLTAIMDGTTKAREVSRG